MLRKILGFTSSASNGQLSPHLAWNHAYAPLLLAELQRLQYTPLHEVFYVLENADYHKGKKIDNQINTLSNEIYAVIPLSRVEPARLEIDYYSHIKFNRDISDGDLQIFIVPKNLLLRFQLPSDKKVLELAKKAENEKKARKADCENHSLVWKTTSQIFNPHIACADAQKFLPLSHKNDWRNFFESYQNKVPPISHENLAEAYKFLVDGGDLRITNSSLLCQ
jgi:hypothetical protein